MQAPPPVPPPPLCGSFPTLETPALKQLVNDYTTTQVLGILWVVGSGFGVLIALVALLGFNEELPVRIGGAVIFLACAGFSLAAGIGTLKRTTSGRSLGMVLSILNLFGFPIGTVIGILGLIAFSRSSVLFGPQRIDPDELRRELQYRKSVAGA